MVFIFIIFTIIMNRFDFVIGNDLHLAGLHVNKLHQQWAEKSQSFDICSTCTYMYSYQLAILGIVVLNMVTFDALLNAH